MRTHSGIKPERTGLKGVLDAPLARNLKLLLRLSGAKRYRRFERITRDPEEIQLGVLRRIIAYATDTVFGREHGFTTINTYEDYKSKVPVRNYEDHRPYIERHQIGETGVLFPGKPLMYNCSSGTTSKPKLLPVTLYDFRTSIKERSKLWLYGVMRHYPGIYDGKCLGVVSPAEDGITADGTPYGSISGLIRKNLPPFVNSTHAAPYDVVHIKDYPTKTYVNCRFSLPADVTLIITANPATVLNIAVKIDKWKEVLVKDIHDGTLQADLAIAPGIRRDLEARLEPAPERAAQIEAYIERHDRLKPEDYWPNLKLIHTWTNGNTGLVVPKLMKWFNPKTPVLDFGYVSSEVLSTDVMVPGNGGSVLAIESGFYEFVRYEDEESGEPEYLMTHQLEIGGRYFIYVTTFSGLYRYDMNDVIEVVDFFNKTPVIKFLFKGKGITNMQGEKLSEAQFIEAVEMTAKKTGMKHDFFIGYADVDSANYRIYIEFFGDYSDAEMNEFGKALDESLCKVNLEYEAKFLSERIRPTVIVPMMKNFFSRYRQLRIEEGAFEGQIKWLHLSSMKSTRDRMERLMRFDRPSSPF
jgi:hypothetical protein